MHVLDELQARGFIQQSTGLDSLREALDEGVVTFYVGVDPTADSMHIGHTIPLMAAWVLQQAGHRVIVIIGGGTAMVGDPSGKTEMRDLISRETIAANMTGMRKQVEALLTIDGERGLIVDNGDWILEFNYIDFLRTIGRHFSVNRMLATEAYKIRLEKGLSFIEFNYQLLQAVDFLELYRRYGCTLQIGGDDQWGNILAGTDLVRRIEGADVHGLTFPLIMTAAGAKMGKTAKGAVWLDPARTSPRDLHQYWLNTDDRDVGRMLRLFTTLPLERIAALEKLEGQALNQAKRVLADQHVLRVHGPNAMPTELPEHVLGPDSELQLYAVLADAGLCASRGEARRLIKGGGVKVNGERVDDPSASFDPAWAADGGAEVRVGKKKAARIFVAG
jgi:tyrosyl-tRNA synthetase